MHRRCVESNTNRVRFLPGGVWSSKWQPEEDDLRPFMAGRNHFRGRGQPHYLRNQSCGGNTLSVGEGKSSSVSSSSWQAAKSTAISAEVSATQQLLAKLRASSIFHPTQEIQLAVYVPPTSVGAIIGRGGRIILNISREAMKRSLGHAGSVRINVLGSGNHAINFNSSGGGGGGSNYCGDALLFGDGSTNNDSETAGKYHNDYPNNSSDNCHDSNTHDNFGPYDDVDNNDKWTPVIIRGDPVGAFAAVRQILPILSAESASNNSSLGNNFTTSNETSCIHDGIVLDVPIHWSKHNLLVGPDGHTIAALSATYQTRIMIPPPTPSSSDRNGNNLTKLQQPQNWQQNQQQLLTSGSGSNATSSTMPSNIIQLEGDDIDMVEQCLAKIISIVAGEEHWVPTGRRIPVDKNKDKQKMDTTTLHTSRKEEVEQTTTTIAPVATAEAVIIKIWTPSSKLLNLGKIRKIQRKTNTTIRRKKMRLVEGVCGGGNVVVLDGKDVVNEELDDDADADDAEEEDKEVGASGVNNDGGVLGKKVCCYLENISPAIFILMRVILNESLQSCNKIYHIRRLPQRQICDGRIRENSWIRDRIIHNC